MCDLFSLRVVVVISIFIAHFLVIQSFSALVKICCTRAHLEILAFALPLELAIFQAHERALALLAKERRSFFALIWRNKSYKALERA